MSEKAAASKYMTFRLASEIYGVPILKVRELIGALEITRVPGAAVFVRGVINLRGKVIAVADLRLKLGMSAEGRSEQAVIMVVQGPRGVMGLLVDEVLEVVTLTDGNIEPAACVNATQFDTSLLCGIGKLESGIVLLLDVDRALTIPEIEARV